MVNNKEVSLRCDCGAEMVCFLRCDFDDATDYILGFFEDYNDGRYTGLLGRIKKAWLAFWNKPIVYTEVMCNDKNKTKAFLEDCIKLIDAES